MRKSALIPAVLMLAVALCGWLLLASAGRATAASGGAPWGELLSKQCDVQIQFMDGQPLASSTWYNGRVVGYDGNCITFVNAGASERIFIPWTAIRQLEILPPGSSAPAAAAP